MNKPIDALLLQPSEAFSDYLTNTAARIDQGAEADAERNGARVGVSRPHESAHLHVAGQATYIDDIPELAGTLHCALGLSPVAHGKLTGMALEKIRALPGVVLVISASDISSQSQRRADHRNHAAGIDAATSACQGPVCVAAHAPCARNEWRRAGRDREGAASPEKHV